MSSQAYVLAPYGYAFATLAYAIYGLRLLQIGRTTQIGGPAFTAYGAAIAGSAAWAAIALATVFFPTSWLSFLHNTSDLIRYGLWFAFLLLLLRPSVKGKSDVVGNSLRPLAAILLLTAFGSMVAGGFGADERDAPSRLSLFSALALPVFGLMLLEQVFRNSSEDRRWNAKPLCIGLGLIFVFDLYMYSAAVLLGQYDPDANSIRGAIHALATPFLLTASRRNSDWVGKLQVSRTAVFHSATLVLAGVYLLLVSAIGYYVRYFGGDWGRALQLALLFVGFAFLAVAVVSGSMRAKLRVLVGKHFFSYRYDYRKEWLRFTTTLSSNTAPTEMGGLVIRGLADMLESPAGCLWSRSADGTELVQTATWNMPRAADRESLASPFSRFLREKGWVIDLNEYRNAPQRYENLQVPPWFWNSPDYWLVIPLLVGEELTGFVVLARARTAIDVNWEVSDLLKTASRQAAGFLAQMHATEALLEVRKFDAFNRMSAFVVHDLKNIVTQLSLMLKNAKRLRDNPEFQEDMLITLESSLEKMRQLMLQLREGAAPPPGATFGVDLHTIAQRLASVATSRGRSLDIEVEERVLTRGQEERIERVLGHVVQNAFDATPPSGRVWLRLHRVSGQAHVEVGDTGHGMSAEFIQTRLFKPFQTTKETGMGIGAYESYQYVQELGGNISVSSELGRGTTVVLVLPLFETQQKSDLQLTGAL